MSAIKKRKEIRFLLLKNGGSSTEAAAQKNYLIKQGYLVVTLIEGDKSMEKGLQSIVENHIS